MSEEDIPLHLKAVGREIGDEGAEAAFRCKCNQLASSCESTIKAGYKAGECYELSCSSPICTNTAWAWCKPCKRRFGSNYITQHSSRKKHRKNSDAFYGTSTSVVASTSDTTNTTANRHAMEIDTPAFPPPRLMVMCVMVVVTKLMMHPFQTCLAVASFRQWSMKCLGRLLKVMFCWKTKRACLPILLH